MHKTPPKGQAPPQAKKPQPPTKTPAKTPAKAPDAEPNRSAEFGGPEGLEPTRYGDWERKGLASDF